jgi:membrane protein
MVSTMAHKREAAGTTARGRKAERPTEVPGLGWKDIIVRTFKETKDDYVPMIAASVAFYAMLALFPALIALVTVYGLIADPGQIQSQLASFTSALPPGASTLVTEQIQNATSGAHTGLTAGLILSLLGVLWSASGGVGGLIKGLNIAYDEDETRGFVKRRGLALVLTVGAIVFTILVIVLLAVLPVVLDVVGLGAAARLVIVVARWPVLAVLVMAALAILYAYGPDRDPPRLRWVTPGAVLATGLWLLGSGVFAVYVRSFGKYDQTYGAIGGVVVLLLWLWLSAFVVLFGAELNAEAERQTRQDTTAGPAKPLGERGAYAADTVGESTT